MVAYRYPLIAREGWPVLFALLLLATAVFLFLGKAVSLPLWCLLGLVLFIYRDPARTIPAAPLAIVAPVDGRIAIIDEVQDKYIDRQAKRVVIDMHVFDVHSTRSPTEGKVIKQWYNHQFAGSDESAQQDSFAQWIQTDESDDVILAVTQHMHLQKPRCYVLSGERIGQGQRCGYVPSAARVEVFVPVSSRIEVREGDTIRAGSDVIASLVH